MDKDTYWRNKEGFDKAKDIRISRHASLNTGVEILKLSGWKGDLKETYEKTKLVAEAIYKWVNR